MKRLISFLLIAVLLMNICASCAKEPLPERVTIEELNVLRDQYPYIDSSYAMASGISGSSLYPTFDSFWAANNPYGFGGGFCAIVVLEVTTNWYNIKGTVLPFADDEMNAVVLEKNPTVATVEWPVVDAKIESVLWGDKSLRKGDTITLGFGSAIGTAGEQLDKVYFEGERYVCMLTDWRNEDIFQNDDLFQIGKESTFHLTSSDVLVSVTSTAGADEISGMYLPAFAELASAVAEKAVAETTQMKEEHQTE